MADRCKIILLGEAAVGKTSIINKFKDPTSSSETKPTVGAAFYNRNLELPNGKNYFLDLWDTAGAEKFRSVNRIFYRGAGIVILVYDITSKKSFEEIQNFWYDEALKEIGENIGKFII